MLSAPPPRCADAEWLGGAAYCEGVCAAQRVPTKRLLIVRNPYGYWGSVYRYAWDCAADVALRKASGARLSAGSCQAAEASMLLDDPDSGVTFESVDNVTRSAKVCAATPRPHNTARFCGTHTPPRSVRFAPGVRTYAWRHRWCAHRTVPCIPLPSSSTCDVQASPNSPRE